MSQRFRREELVTSQLELGATAIDLADYATTGLRIVTVGPSGIGKTNAGLLCAEQLAAQGWQAILMDPEGEISALYPTVLETPEALERHLVERTGPPIGVVPVRDAGDFLPFGHVIMKIADQLRQPIFLMLDETQIFSTSRRKGKADVLGQASDLINEFLQRGRKRALDLFLSAHRFSGSLNRAAFGSKRANAPRWLVQETAA